MSCSARARQDVKVVYGACTLRRNIHSQWIRGHRTQCCFSARIIRFFGNDFLVPRIVANLCLQRWSSRRADNGFFRAAPRKKKWFCLLSLQLQNVYPNWIWCRPCRILFNASMGTNVAVAKVEYVWLAYCLIQLMETWDCTNYYRTFIIYLLILLLPSELFA